MVLSSCTCSMSRCPTRVSTLAQLVPTSKDLMDQRSNIAKERNLFLWFMILLMIIEHMKTTDKWSRKPQFALSPNSVVLLWLRQKVSINFTLIRFWLQKLMHFTKRTLWNQLQSETIEFWTKKLSSKVPIPNSESSFMETGTIGKEEQSWISEENSATRLISTLPKESTNTSSKSMDNGSMTIRDKPTAMETISSNSPRHK